MLTLILFNCNSFNKGVKILWIHYSFSYSFVFLRHLSFIPTLVTALPRAIELYYRLLTSSAHLRAIRQMGSSRDHLGLKAILQGKPIFLLLFLLLFADSNFFEHYQNLLDFISLNHGVC